MEPNASSARLGSALRAATSRPTDNELLRRARSDADAYGLFFDRHARRVHAYFARATGDDDAATDLTAETFAQAFVSLGRFRGDSESSGVAWLFGIARRVLLHSFRDQGRERRARGRLGIRGDVAGWDQAQSDARLDTGLLQQSLAAALDVLSPEQREAVRLRVIDELDYRQIGAALGCSSVAARIRVSRGLRALLERLEGDVDV